MKIAVVGSVNLDLVARTERLPRPGETITGATLERIPGGKGGNQALAAARLGADVELVACVGRDAFAVEATAELEAAGVTLALHEAGDQTGVALIVVGADGENQIVVSPGANALLSPDDVDVAGADGVLCQLEIPVETVQAAARADAFFCLNAAPARRLPRELLERADLVVVNRLELELLGEVPGLVARTLGADGAVLLDEGREIAHAVPPPVTAVDGTAAGDAFTACLVVSHLEGRDWDEALRRACIAGAIAASRPGAQPSLPTKEEVDALL